jgi:hypothetical protein
MLKLVTTHGKKLLYSYSYRAKADFTPEQAMKVQKRVEVQLYSFFNHSARRRWVVNATPLPFFPWKRDPVPISREAG